MFQTHADAPRVLIANSNLVGNGRTWDHFHELDRKGLMMYGQMTAGSWIYIGSQGIVQGTYETFVEAGRQHFNGDLRGKWILTGGLGGMGGAQPLAATMAGAAMLAIECQPSRIEKRIATGYLDKWTKNLDEALAMIARRLRQEAGDLGRAARQCRGDFSGAGTAHEAGDKRARPDIVTDQTSAHDPLNGYLPAGWTLDQHESMQASDPDAVVRAAKQSMAVQVRAMLDFHRMGIPTLDYGNNIRQMAQEMGVADAFDFPGFVPAYIRPLFCRGIGPFRWAALSGDPEDIYRTDARVKELLPDNKHLHTWLDMARDAHQVPGLAGAHLLGGAGRSRQARPRLQRDGGQGRGQGADRHRPRPSRFRLGRQPVPRDRGDEGRLRRGRGLAAAQRAAQLRVGRHLGVDPQWRRRGHRLLAACRHGDRRATAPRKRRGA